MKNTAFALMVALAVFGCAPSEPTEGHTGDSKPPSEVSLKALAAAPEFDLENIAGGKLNSADLKGKVVIADIWATWCGPCIQEIPSFNEIHNKYRDKDVAMIAITVESGPIDDVRPKVQEFDMQYPVVMGDDAVVEGFGGIIGFPTTIVIGKDWKVYRKQIGAKPKKKELLERDIDLLLQQ